MYWILAEHRHNNTTTIHVVIGGPFSNMAAVAEDLARLNSVPQRPYHVRYIIVKECIDGY